jgi:Fe-S oxidoreductase
MHELQYDPKVCQECETYDCLTRCQYINIDIEEAREERSRILRGEDCRVLRECATCYACEEYCPYGNHPFYQIVERQEQLETWPVPIPLTKQQIRMMAPRRQIAPQKVQAPVINMCFFPMLSGCIRGKLFEGATTISGSDIFCNIMWLHFAKNSVIRERLPEVIENIQNYYLKGSGVEELVCFHDECYGAFTHLAPAFSIEVPFKSVHLFEYLARRLTELKSEIRPLSARVAYQRPCSNRLIPQTQHWVDEIFRLVGVDRVERQYDGENALCC